MARVESPPLPAPGEPVRFRWGLRSVPGHVAEVYPSHPSPRVVVLIDPGVASDDAATVSVPLDDVEPAPGADSPWATAFRFEADVAAALARLGEEPTRAGGADHGWDIVVPGPHGPIGIQVKDHVRRSQRDASARGALLVTRDDVPENADPRVRWVRWRDEDDDPALAAALADLREAS